jgi:hypothetical protein
LVFVFSIERRSILVVAYEQCVQILATEHGKHPVYTDGRGVWYSQACKFLKIGTSSQDSSFDRSMIIERTIIQYVKDRIECFDDSSL